MQEFYLPKRTVFGSDNQINANPQQYSVHHIVQEKVPVNININKNQPIRQNKSLTIEVKNSGDYAHQFQQSYNTAVIPPNQIHRNYSDIAVPQSAKSAPVTVQTIRSPNSQSFIQNQQIYQQSPNNQNYYDQQLYLSQQTKNQLQTQFVQQQRTVPISNMYQSNMVNEQVENKKSFKPEKQQRKSQNIEQQPRSTVKEIPLSNIPTLSYIKPVDLQNSQLNSQIQTQLNNNYDENKSAPLVKPVKSKPNQFYPPQPISMVYETINNTICEKNVIVVQINYKTFEQPKFFIINKYMNLCYYQSASPIKMTPIDSKRYELVFEYSLTDVGSYPYVIIQDYEKQFTYPLHYLTVQSNQQFQLRTSQIYQNQFQTDCAFIELEGPFIQLSQFVLNRQTLEIVQESSGQQCCVLVPQELQVIHPSCFYVTPNDHPATMSSTMYFSLCQNYKETLSFKQDLFFTDNGWESVCLADPSERVQEETNTFVLIKLQNRIFCLGFRNQNDAQLAYLSLLQFKNVLYPQNEVNHNIIDEVQHKQNIHWLIKAAENWFGDYPFQTINSIQLFEIYNDEVYLHSQLDIQKKKPNVEVFVVSTLKTTQKNGDTLQIINSVTNTDFVKELDMQYCYQQLELWAFDRNVVQRQILTQQLIPRDNFEIQQFITTQSKKKQQFNVSLSTSDDISYEATLIIYKFYVTLTCKQLFSYNNVDYKDIQTFFGGKQSFYMNFQGMGCEVECQCRDDFLKFMYFFTQQ